MNRVRLDTLIYQRGLVDSREQARKLILAGQVLVDGQPAVKVATPVAASAQIEVREQLPYVSRGGLKLEKALHFFGIDPTGRVVADVGASTGGFVDCLLKHGAVRVYAIDVGYGQLAWSLQQDQRVVVMDRTNARYLDALPELVDLATVDVSFISLRLILPQVQRWLKPSGQTIALVKPQFEAGQSQVGKGGVVRSLAVHTSVLQSVLHDALDHGWHLLGLTSSPIRGSKGNREFLAWLGMCPRATCVPLAQAIEEAVLSPA